MLVLLFFGDPSASYGEKSKQMCEEYGKAVYALEGAAVLLPDAAALNVSNCGIVEVPLIIGGVTTGVKEFPHMTVVGYGEDPDVTWLCGGSLISQKFVLTAAHCLKSKDKGPARWVRMGSRSLDESDPEARVQRLRVSERIPHPRFKVSQSYNDLALLRLDRDVEFDGFVRPACLQVNPEVHGNKAIATGFGKTDYFKDKVSKELMKVTLSLVPNEVCNKTFEGDVGSSKLAVGVVETQLCAGQMEGGKDTCQGDSGGPLQQVLEDPYCMYSLIGVTSFGKFCGFRNSPAVYTRVSSFIPWIEGVVWSKEESTSKDVPPFR